MDAVDLVPALAAIPSLNDLFAKLLELSKDGKTAALANQMQLLLNTVQSESSKVQFESLKIATQNYELTRKIGQLEDAQAETIAALNASHAAAETALRKSHAAEIARLVAGYKQAEADIAAKQQQAASQYQQTIASLQQRIAEMTPKPTVRRRADGLPVGSPDIPPALRHRKVLPPSRSKGQRR